MTKPPYAQPVEQVQRGIGCQRCGSVQIKQTAYTLPSGFAIAVAGVLCAVVIHPIFVVLGLAAVIMRGEKSICQACYYTWRAL